MNITISSIEKVFLTNSDVKKGQMKSLINDLTSNQIPFDVNQNGRLEISFFDNPHVEDSKKRLATVLKKYVESFSNIVWKSSPLNVGISNIKEIFIRDLENSLTIPINQFKKMLEKSSLNYRFTGTSFGLYFKKPNFTYDITSYTSDFEKVLRHVKSIAIINWQ